MYYNSLMPYQPEALKQAVFSRQKTLAEIYRAKGRQPLFDYVNNWPVGNGVLDSKFAAVFHRLLHLHYSKAADAVAAQLSDLPLVSTIDHSGILNHPFFINSNLIYSLRKGIRYLICLPTAGVSLNNSSFPGCMMYHDAQGELRRLSFFPDRLKTIPVLSAPAITPSSIPPSARAEDLFQRLFADSSVFALPNFVQQTCFLSSRVWQLVFPSAPQLIYIPLEDLIGRIITDVIAVEKNHILHWLFFSSPGWRLLEKYFYGLKGAFGENHGTFLFWGVDDFGRRLRFVRQGLRIKDKRYFSLALQPVAVAESLQKSRIYPASLTCFLVLLYYRLTCLGGFNQVNWLTDIKRKFIELLLELRQRTLAESLSQIPTDNFSEGNLVFLYHQQKLIRPSAWDIYRLLPENRRYEKYEQLARSLTVGESIETLLPEIYRAITPQAERLRGLIEPDDQLILASRSVQQKIKAILF